jgi:hypothetical protein
MTRSRYGLGGVQNLLFQRLAFIRIYLREGLSSAVWRRDDPATLPD